MLHWYMNNPEYRVYEPSEHEPSLQLDIDDDALYDVVEDDSSTLIGTITSNLTRSRSGSRRRFRTRSVRLHQQLCSPTRKHAPNVLSNTDSTKRQETIYMN